MWLCGRILLLLCALGSATAPAAAAAAQSRSELPRLIEEIATGDEDDAADATDELIERIVAPLTKALEGIENRPAEQRRRLLKALDRVTAVLRLRLYRGALPEADRKLFDEFVARNGELVEMLFRDDPGRRLEALHQIPLAPGSGAGVLMVAKVRDWDAQVADEALQVAGALKDEVVVRGLTRYVAEVTQAVKSGELGPAQQDVALVYTNFAGRAIRILGEAGAKDSVPVILDGLACFRRPPYRQLFPLAETLEALGKIGDERAVPALIEFLNDRELCRIRSVGPGRLVQQTVGDAALLALARIFGLPPEKLGFYVDPASPATIGFTDEKARVAALDAFRQWHRQNAQRPRGERAPLTTRAAEGEKSP